MSTPFMRKQERRMPILPAEDRPTGFYLIIASDDPEVALWDAEAQGWALVGGYEGETDAGVKVLSGPILPPDYWRTGPQ
jgi:hypothetical protein